MDEEQQDQYEAQLKEVFDSFDTSGSGCLSAQEFSGLCQALLLDEDTATLLRSFLHSPDGLVDRVDFEQFKDALILALTKIGGLLESQEACGQLGCPEVNPTFLKEGMCYDHWSSPELNDSVTGLSKAYDTESTEGAEEAVNNTVPEKCEIVSLQHWDAHTGSAEEYEAKGQLHLWNPDEPYSPRRASFPLTGRVEERLHVTCGNLGFPWDGCASRLELLSLCQNLGLEVTENAFPVCGTDEVMNVREFVLRILKQSSPSTPAVSTPYRRLKRCHSTQAYDETGRRIAAPSAMPDAIGLQLFSSLDDGTGYAQPECIMDAWLKEGIENSPEILQALDFSLDTKVNLSELTAALENELLVTRNSIHQTVLASFKAEIKYLLGKVDLEIREKEKLHGDLEMAEKLKTQMATEVDEHHLAIELINNVNISKLEQDHKQKLAAIRAELTKDMDTIQQQANQQSEELAKEMEKTKNEVTFLRERLALSVKENEQVEAELLDGTEKLVEAENLIFKLQRNLNSVLKEKFDDLDPDSSVIFLQEERIHQLRNHYEEKCRELQDRIDELHTQLEEYHRPHRTPHISSELPLSEEFDSKVPVTTSDQDESQHFNMNLEAEMLVENLKIQHLEVVNKVKNELESKICEYKKKLEEQRAFCEEQQNLLLLKWQEEVQVLKDNLSKVQNRACDLQSKFDQAELLQIQVERQHEQKVSGVNKELFESQTCSNELKEKLKALELDQARLKHSFAEEKEELMRIQEEKYIQLEEHYMNNLQEQLKEERLRIQMEKEVMEVTLAEWKKEMIQLQETQEKLHQDKLEKKEHLFKDQYEDLEKRLKQTWENEKNLLEEQQKRVIQVLLEEERTKHLRDQKEAERKLVEHLENERAAEEKERKQLEEKHQKAIQELDAFHLQEKEHLNGLLDKLQKDIAEERHELEQLKKEKMAAQKISENLKRQVSELLVRGQQLEADNEFLSQKNMQNTADLHELNLQLNDLLMQHENKAGRCHEVTERLEIPAIPTMAEQEMKMLAMEQRMWDVELKLRKVKLLMQEKVSQLKRQLVENTKAGVVIKDLHMENSQLLKMLDITKQQKKAAERKNYLLEEKISSLNKIVHDLSPSPLSTAPYHF